MGGISSGLLYHFKRGRRNYSQRGYSTTYYFPNSALVTKNVSSKTFYFSEIGSHPNSKLSLRDGGQTGKAVIVTVPPRAEPQQVLPHKMDRSGPVAKWTRRGATMDTMRSAGTVFGNWTRNYIPKLGQKGGTWLTGSYRQQN